MNVREFGEKVGVPREDMNKILAEIKANSAKLDGCIVHDFSICLDRRTKQPIAEPTPQQTFGGRWRCKNCGGEVDASAKRWYNLGLEHGK